MKKILIVEDDISQKKIMSQILKKIGLDFSVDWTETAEEAAMKIQSNKYDLIIADISLKGEETGLDFWKKCSNEAQETPVIIISGTPVADFLKETEQSYVTPAFIPKPLRIGECQQIISGVLNYRR